MEKNRPIRDKVVKRTPDVRGQIHAAARERQDKSNKGDEKIEKLKGQIVTTKRTNNVTRGTAIGGVVAGIGVFNFVILQGNETLIDESLKYVIALGGCLSAGLINLEFSKKDKKLNEMLSRANVWSRQEFTPEEIQTFKELYDEINKDYADGRTFTKSTKGDFVYASSQGIILALALATMASAIDKLDPKFFEELLKREETLEVYQGITLDVDDINDPFLKVEKNLRFPEF